MHKKIGSAAERRQTRLQAFIFSAKAWVFRLRRLAFQQTVPRLEKTERPKDTPLAAQCVTPLRTSTRAEEQRLQEGKVRNLAVAARFLDGLRIPAGTVFSFWRHVPRPTFKAGFAEGRELREGCIVPSLGGGLCQLSNALYAAALDAGCDIVERHAHSRVVPGSAAAAGRDATVFWNYVDLRFRPKHPLWLEVTLSADHLVVRLHGNPAVPRFPSHTGRATSAEEPAHSCETCGQRTCFRHGDFHGDGR